MILVSAFGVATAANGLSLVLDASFIISMLIVGTLYGFKLYFLMHRQPRFERTPGGQRDKVFIYLILAFIMLALMSFGLYGFGNTSEAATPLRNRAEIEQQASAGESPISQLDAADAKTESDTAGELAPLLPPSEWNRRSLAQKPADQQPDKPNDQESFTDFISATRKKGTYAIVCWIIAGVIEALTLILALRNPPPSDPYWD
jgi:hypothetical protein